MEKKEDTAADLFYSNQSFDVKTSAQQKNKLLELDEQKRNHSNYI